VGDLKRVGEVENGYKISGEKAEEYWIAGRCLANDIKMVLNRTRYGVRWNHASSFFVLVIYITLSVTSQLA